MKTAKAQVNPVRQRTQYTCMSTSMTMCLQALDHDVTEDEVNKVMGARPMKGASWEQALACAQHYGCRATLTMPSTIRQLKQWTDAGSAVMIAWNPEGRDWSHASVVYDVTDSLPDPVPPYCTVIGERAESGPWVWVADPNIPNPDKTVRLCFEDDFYSKWYESWPNYLVRRPACAIEREISQTGRQMMASDKALFSPRDIQRVAHAYLAARKKKPKSMKDRMKVDTTDPAQRNVVQQDLVERGNSGGGRHHTRGRDVAKGRSRKPKHKQDHTATYSSTGKEIDYVLLGLVARIGPFSARNPRERKGLDTLVDAGLVVRYLSTAGHGIVYEASDDGRNALGRRASGDLKHLAGYKGNPGGKDIYPNEIDHGTKTEPLSGGTDVMRRLQNRLLHEQGDVVPQRPASPKVSHQYRFDKKALDESAARVATAWTLQQEND